MPKIVQISIVAKVRWQNQMPLYYLYTVYESVRRYLTFQCTAAHPTKFLQAAWPLTSL